MCNVVIVRPGSTAFDDEERMKGCMDMPLSTAGQEQVHKAASEIAKFPIAYVYSAPCESAQSTAKEISELTKAKWKVCDGFRNMDHGLWQGKLVDEIKRQQPRLFKQLQENPLAFNPPGGESISEAQVRIDKVLTKLLKKHATETIAVVISEPLASLVASKLKSTEFEDVWKSEQDDGTWELIDAESGIPIATNSKAQDSVVMQRQLEMEMPHSLEQEYFSNLRGTISK